MGHTASALYDAGDHGRRRRYSSSVCQLQLPDAAVRPAKEHRSYTTLWDTTPGPGARWRRIRGKDRSDAQSQALCPVPFMRERGKDPPLTSRHGLEIRAATVVDAPGLATLLAEAGQIADGRELAERLMALRTAAGAVLVAVRWGPPSGLLVMHWYFTLHAARPTAQITTLLVSAEERRLGIGRLLVKAAAQAARTAGCGSIELTAAFAAMGLHEFCRATGFVGAGPRFARSLRKGA
jgi:aminoglycoside 6'-N-acetyltransferase I